MDSKSQITFEESQLARIKEFKSTLLEKSTKMIDDFNQLNLSYLNHLNAKINQVHHNMSLFASKLPDVSLSKRVIQHNRATYFPSKNNAKVSNDNVFLGLSGAVVDRARDISPELVLTLTSYGTVKLEGTLTDAMRFEFPTHSLISRTLIDDVNRRHLSKELFETICNNGLDTDDHKYRMTEGQFVMGVVDLRGEGFENSNGSPSRPEVHKVLLRPDQDLLVEHYMNSKLVPLTKKSKLSHESSHDSRLLIESVLVKELHPILALEPNALTILSCFQPHRINSESELLTPPKHYNNSTQLSHARSFFTAIKKYRNSHQIALNEPFMGVDVRRALAKAKGHVASSQIIKSTNLILPDIQRYRIWRTIRYEEQVNPELTHYYSINFLVIEDDPQMSSTIDAKTTTNSFENLHMQQPKYHFEVLFRMSPIKMDTAQNGYQHRFILSSPFAVESYIHQLRWTFAAEGNGRRKCVTDISNPNALSNIITRKSKDDNDDLSKVFRSNVTHGTKRNVIEGSGVIKKGSLPQSDLKKTFGTPYIPKTSTSKSVTTFGSNNKSNNSIIIGGDSKKPTNKSTHNRKRFPVTSTEDLYRKSSSHNSGKDNNRGNEESSNKRGTHK